ncbi:MAG: hypothetical protein P5685_25515 [Limnospira sp. PMC 1261.20]|nr:hypothetical protein [Limnospira sp. PMC 1261.20]MDT9242179.1 hypothetical protein [Limnospira sp. PMC 1261.20]
MYLSCEVNTAHEVLTHLRGYEALFEDCGDADHEDRAIARIVDLVNTCAFHFGLCEIYARKAGRADVIGSKPEIQHFSALSQAHQKKGLEALASAISAGEVLLNPTKVPSRTVLPQLRERGAALNQDILAYIAGSELKPSDIVKVEKALTATLDACNAEQTPGVVIVSRLKALEEIRLREDRGNVDNLPYWKIAIIAVYAGLTIWKVWRCIIRNRCSRAEKAAIETALAIAGISLKFC